jgi:non-heme chloroperoxidase
VGIDPGVSFYQATVDFWDQLQKDRIPKTEEFVRLIFKQPQTEEYYKKLMEVALRTPTNTVMTLMSSYIFQDFRSLLPHINVPTLIATTEGPRLEYMKSIQKQLLNSRLEIFKMAGHALFVDQPKEFNSLIETFIVSLEKNKAANTATAIFR